MPIRCLHCDEANLEPRRVTLQGNIRNETYTVMMQGLACPNCDYSTIDGAAMPEYRRLLADQYRAKHGLLTSEQIRERRRRLEMSQEVFAQHLGVGVASVKRWEMGKIQDERSNALILERTGPVYHTVCGNQFLTAGSTASYSGIVIEGLWNMIDPHHCPECTQTASPSPILNLPIERTMPAFLASRFSTTPRR